MYPELFKTALFLSLFSVVIDASKRRSFGQLPTSLSPVLYRVSIQPYFPADGISYPPNKEFTFDANLSIIIQCVDDSDNITLHMNEIELDEKAIRLTRSDTNGLLPLTVSNYDNVTQQIVFASQQRLEQGKVYELRLRYTGKLDGNALAGLYPSNYMENGTKRWLVVTQFEPTDARRVIPSFDEPFYKASFDVTIIHPSSMVALSNSMETGTERLGNGWSKTQFEPTVNMSTYLLAMAVCDFRSKSAYTSDKKTLFRVWARPSFISKVDYALAAGPKVLDYYSEFFKIPFPLKKQDMLALPDFAAGAMENWGLVTYREVSLLYDPKESTPRGRRRVAVVIAHELAHQWFGDLVTMEWWDDLWLNEGFASYMEYVGTDVISDGKFRMDEEITYDAVSSALSLDQLSTSHPIFVPVASPDEINEIFDAISYSKGAAIIRMLNYTITDEMLRKGLQIYLTKKRYQNANHNDLWSALTEAVQKQGWKYKDWRNEPLNVTDFMNPWILQMGYPVLNVKRRYGEKKKVATVDQERFVISDKTPTAGRPEFLSPPYNFTWYVPVWYQSGNSLHPQSAWLVPNKTLTLYLKDDEEWLLVNYERAAYCRVNYDDRNWHLLANQLHTDHSKINIKNRVQLIDDSMQLARANKLSYKIAMDMTMYLLNETDFSPWGTAFKAFGYIERMLAPTDGYNAYKNYVAALTYSLYQRLGWDDSKEPVDDVSAHNLRSLILSQLCWFGLEDCHVTALNHFKKFVSACSNGSMSSDCSPIPPNLRSVVYCEGAKNEEEDTDWELLWTLHAKEEVAAEKERLIAGLSCTKKPAFMYRLLNETIKESSTIIRRQDGADVFGLLSDNNDARPLLWPFVESNWHILHELYTSGMAGLNDILASAAVSFNTEDKLDTLKKFYKKHTSELHTAKRGFEQVLEIVEANIDWMKRNGDTIISWLKHQPLIAPPEEPSKPLRSSVQGVRPLEG